jgi:hypothetical protein
MSEAMDRQPRSPAMDKDARPTRGPEQHAGKRKTSPSENLTSPAPIIIQSSSEFQIVRD